MYHRRSIRLPGYDYRKAGVYFVTLCSWRREAIFGEISSGVMCPNVFGRIVTDDWQRLAQLYTYVDLDEWILMPNHMHGIIVLAPDGGKSLGRLIGAFKTMSTKDINSVRVGVSAPLWQRNFYERIVRNDRELDRIRAYIAANPERWETDPDTAPCVGGGTTVM